MATFQLTIVTPVGKRFDGPAESLTATGEEGAFGILAHHAPMIASLRSGVMTVQTESGTSFFSMGEGVLEVSMGNSVIILADRANPADSFDTAKRDKE